MATRPKKADLKVKGSGIPPWIPASKVDGFRETVNGWSREFEVRWDGPSKGKRSVEAEIQLALSELRDYWKIPIRDVRKQMVAVQELLPINLRVASLSSVNEVHANQYARLLEYLEARYADRWFEAQSVEFKEKATMQTSLANIHKHYIDETYRNLALALFIAIKIINMPVPMSRTLVKLVARDHSHSLPCLWRGLIKQGNTRISFMNKKGEQGLLERFLNFGKPKLRKSCVRLEDKDLMDLSPTPEVDKRFLIAGVVILTERMVNDYKRSRARLGGEFHVDLWFKEFLNRLRLGGATIHRGEQTS